MKNSFKKVAALALAILMLLMLVPASLASDGETVSNAVVPGLSDGGTLLTSLQKYSAMFEKLMAEEDPSAFADLAAQYMQDAGFLDWLENSVNNGTLSSDQIDALNAKTALSLEGVDTLALNKEYEVNVGESKTLSGAGQSLGLSEHQWTSSNTSIATVKGNGNSATVTGVAVGEVTITHTYKQNNQTQTETCIVKVVIKQEEDREASVFYLKSPTSNPDANSTSEFGAEVKPYATVNLTGATLVTGSAYMVKNVFKPAPYIKSMPGTKQSDGSYLLPKKGNETHYDAIYNAYKSELAKDLGIQESEFSEDDIEEIYLVPYKISINNWTGDRKTHIDCTVKVKCKNFFVAKFWVQKPGSETESLVEAKNYRSDSLINKTEKAPTTGTTGNYPDQTTVDGVEYVFDGWYNEAGEKVDDSSWPYTPNKTELADGVVEFRAHYVPKQTTVTVQKTVESDVSSDKEQDFSFTYQIDDGDTQPFTLKHNESKEIPVNNGSKIVVTETSDPNFITTYSIGSTTTATSGSSATIGSVGADAQTITFVNTRKTAALKLKKLLSDENNSSAKFNFTVTYSLNGENQTKTYTLGNNEFSDEIKVPIGTQLTITESNAAIYTTTATYGGTACLVTDGEDGSRSFIVTASESATTQEIVVTNTIKTGKLVIKKNVTGGWGDKTRQFSFTHDYGEENTRNFNLSDYGKSNGVYTLYNIPYGTKVTITEQDYTGDNGGYTTFYTVSTGETNVGGIESTPSSVQSRIATVTINAPVTTVTFTNDKQATTPTGVLLDSLPYILILVAIAVVAGVVIVRRRRSRDDD